MSVIYSYVYKKLEATTLDNFAKQMFFIRPWDVPSSHKFALHIRKFIQHLSTYPFCHFVPYE